MKTVKVKIAVAIDSTGNWCASGWKGATLSDMLNNVLDDVEEGEARYWLETEIEIPEQFEAKVIQARVTKNE